MNTMMSSVAAAGRRIPSVAERDTMEREGYLIVRGFFDAAETAKLLRWTEDLQHAPQVRGRHWVYHEQSLVIPGQSIVQRIENFCPFHDGFDAVVRDAALQQWTASLMGGPVVLFKDKINFKMPGGPGFKPHQDQQAGWTRYVPWYVTALVTLDPSTIENGCLEIAPRGHERQLIGEEWVPLAEDGLDLVPVPTAPGDVIFFDSYTPHASKPNLTDAPRRILYLTYNLATDGDHRAQYYADKFAAFPPDIERDGTTDYVFRV